MKYADDDQVLEDDQPPELPAEPKPFISNRVFDILKWVALVVLPSLGTLYLLLAEVWGLPDGVEIYKTIIGVEAFLGAILGLSAFDYKQRELGIDGVLPVNPNEELASRKTVTLKVVSH